MSNDQANDCSVVLAEKVKAAHDNGTILNIRGGQTKSFLANSMINNEQVNEISVVSHQGIVNYVPSELVITARSGTLLKDIKKLLSENNQMLAFEPPSYGDDATLGGTIACAMSGSRRPYAGSARDFVLGVRLINGRGEILHFGGEVMKNVAGYDVSRLMTGAMGTLGILLEISLKVLPVADEEITLTEQLQPAAARLRMLELARKYLPISGMSYSENLLSLRLSGARSAVEATVKKLGGDLLPESGAHWQAINEQQQPFFQTEKNLWRLSLPADNDWHKIETEVSGEYLVEWGGALVWLVSDDSPEKIFSYAEKCGGHAQLYRQKNRISDRRHQPLTHALLKWHKNIKQAFDPKAVFNPGVMYKDI